MYVDPKKFVESDFVTRMRKKYSAASEDGTVYLTPKGTVLFCAIGIGLGTVASVALNVAILRILDKDNNTEESPED